MKLYNTLTRKIEEFKPQDPANVKIYTCGPTVYDHAHVGNLTSYIYWDLLVRTLLANHYTPNRVLNLTDVGHLSSDADEGEDKLEKGARREHKTVWEIAEMYSDIFLHDFAALNLTPPDHICRATDFIDEDIALVDRLTAKGFTYETADGIYFDTSKFPSYADFARLDTANLKAGARIEMTAEKRHKTDFALWKFIAPGENHAMHWTYLGREGYPGWHIECSTIIHEILGETIDIHTGGIDHIPVHHSNEIAQSESAFDKKLSNYWLHCSFITIDNQKISKSLGNTYTLAELQEKGIAPLDFKMWVLSGHFQGTRNFSLEDLTAAHTHRLHWKNQMIKSYQLPANDHPELLQTLISDISNNLNSPLAFSHLDAALSTETLSKSDWTQIDQLFGLDLVSPDISGDFKALIEARAAARAAKDFATSDRIRDELAAENLGVQDGPVPVWYFLS